MKVLDEGHRFQLDCFDGDLPVILTFVKREGEMFPGNVGSYSGTIMQEVIRALISRTKYVNNQIPHPVNDQVIDKLREVIWLLESRAFERHDKEFDLTPKSIEELSTNKHGHLWKETEDKMKNDWTTMMSTAKDEAKE